MTTPARGSAPYFNQIVRNAVLRSKELADATIKMVTQAGYPPLTEPLTLAILEKMGYAGAVTALRAELERTTKIDEATGDAIPDKATVKLATDYIRTHGGPP